MIDKPFDMLNPILFYIRINGAGYLNNMYGVKEKEMQMTKKHSTISRILSIIMVISMVFAMTACGDKKADSKSEDFGLDRENSLIYGAEFEDEQVNPMLSDEHLQCSALLYRGLMKTDKDCKPEKDIATDVKVSDDLLTYDFTIRDDEIGRAHV